MKTIQYSIAPQVFEKFPEYIRGVVLAVGVSNGKSSPELIQLLRDEEKSLQQRLKVDEITNYPKINSWREAFRSLGIKPSEYRSSIEAMSRRVLRGNELPSINALVDIGNILSLRHLVPMAGHALDGSRQISPCARLMVRRNLCPSVRMKWNIPIRMSLFLWRVTRCSPAVGAGVRLTIP